MFRKMMIGVLAANRHHVRWNASQPECTWLDRSKPP
jgi:hypothetical protein